MEQHHLNKLTQLITEAILDAAKKSIPRRTRKQYTPGGITNYRSCMMRPARIAQEQETENIPTDGCITDAIQKDELEAEIRTLKS